MRTSIVPLAALGRTSHHRSRCDSMKPPVCNWSTRPTYSSQDRSLGGNPPVGNPSSTSMR